MMLFLVDRDTSLALDNPSHVMDILRADRPREQRLFSLDRVAQDLFAVMERAGLGEPATDLRSEGGRHVEADGNQLVRVLEPDVVTFVRDWLVPMDAKELRRAIGSRPVINDDGEPLERAWRDELIALLLELSAWLETAWRPGDVMLVVRPA